MTRKEYKEKVIELRNKARAIESDMLNNDKWDLVEVFNNAFKEYAELYLEYRKKYNVRIK